MIGTWRISDYNAVLVAGYLVPAWVMSVLQIVESPIRGLYDRSNIAFGVFFSDEMQLAALGMARAAWGLAVVRLTVAAFVLVFLLQIASKRRRLAGAGDEPLAIALTLGGLFSFAGMMLAARAGEGAAMQLHATESLLLLGAAILVLAEPWMRPAPVRADAAQPAATAPADPVHA
ncbi:MAG: hypothetical protein DCC74_11045 [Proteobacteria bacterium]|nr:MAG: hypothetical protein DCC74_11045 [Pseudomonadota bacterium]